MTMPDDHTWDRLLVRWGDRTHAIAPNYPLRIPVNATITGGRYGEDVKECNIAAQSNDVVQMRDGEVFVNDKMVFSFR